MTEVTAMAGRMKKFMARRFTAPSADAELTPGHSDAPLPGFVEVCGCLLLAIAVQRPL